MGCQSVRYYGQAIRGQADILRKRTSIEKLIADQGVPEKLKARLRLVLEIRRFAEKELQLPAGGHYLTYVGIDRPYVAWNVFAAPEFSLEPRTWRYPFVGCAAYRGYFAEKDALEYAEELKGEGLDVHVGGVEAYSTLGWFDDPVFSSFIMRSEASLAGLVFHELAHQAAFAPGDTTFNESFAVAVEQEGVRRWFESAGKKDAYAAYLKRRDCSDRFTQLVEKYRVQLETLYGKDIGDAEKREEKARTFAALKEEYGTWKREGKGCAGYDSWFEQPANNALIISVSVYNDLVPAFERLLLKNGGDLRKFYGECKALAGKPEEERQERLRKLLTP
ncbi:MAG: aminopeptidase [Nitrospinae bacterium]|nr:aminopeptidase [Nitrospinota bacterium]